MLTMLFHALLTISVILATALSVDYQPTWDSLDSRPLPAWYDQAKVGIFVHWGVFSVPALWNSNFWQIWEEQKPDGHYAKFMKEHYRPDWTYADFAEQFTAEFFDANEWIRVFNKSGARYVVFTTKHHEGFCNWKTNYSFNWNSVQVGPKRDITDELVSALRVNSTMRVGLYHSMFEWFNNLYLNDKLNNYTTSKYVQGKTLPELHEIVNTYKPDLIWSDGDWEATDDYWNSKQFLAWLYNDSPVRSSVVVNDRWGKGMMCKHGGYLTCKDRFNPQVLMKRKFENCFTIQKLSWGYRRDCHLDYYLTAEQIIITIIQTISCGGNVLINVGPTHDGRILPIFEERLTQMGDWLNVNSEAVYETTSWSYQNDTISGTVWYTMKKSPTSVSGYSVYAMITEWPLSSELILGSVHVTPDTTITMLGLDVILQYEYTQTQLVITLPFIPPNTLPFKTGWTLRIDGAAN